MTENHSPSAKPFLRVMLLWLLLAGGLGAAGVTAKLRPPVPQLTIVLLTAALIATGAAHRGLHAWLARVNLRGVVAFHVTRFVGIAFLVLYSKGELPYAFAVPGGWGDIAVATLALALVLFLPVPEAQPRLLMLWNALGLADILGAVFTGARLGMTEPGSMLALLRFPMNLVPMFIVPLVIASHLLVFWRLRQLRR